MSSAILVLYGAAEIIAPPLMGIAVDVYGVNWQIGVAALAVLFLAGRLVIGLYRSRLGPILGR